MVFTLGSRGRDFLAQELGLPVSWYFRPEKVRSLSFRQVAHSLFLTRFLVAAEMWSKAEPDYDLSQTRISYQLARAPASVAIGEKAEKETVTVIPDAWLLFEKLQNGRHARWYPVLLEVDRGTEYQQKFKQHIRSRIEFIRSGAYKEMFGVEWVTIAYVTTGETAAYRETRRRTMCSWAWEVLREQQREEWASIFRFHELPLEGVYKSPMFAEPVWFQPDQRSPVSLFA
jgi:hypothetical protein